jgi:exosortase F-associated protein
MKKLIIRWLPALIGGLFLVLMYQLQNFNFLKFFQGDLVKDISNKAAGAFTKPEFAVNKIIRYAINDISSMAIIWSIFQRKDFIKFSVLVFLFGLLILLPVYLTLFFTLEKELGVVLHYYHRLVVNPTLLLLLIPAFFYQQSVEKQKIDG